MEIPAPVRLTARFLQFLSPKLATQFAAKLFTTPIKHKTPKRELQMEEFSKQEKLFIPGIQKEIVLYHYGQGEKKVLLVHGWSGRGTQLVKIADELLKQGYSTISFDAPAHGKSKGNNTLMPEFIASILEIEKQYGLFDYAIGHSLGGISILNALKDGFQVKKAIIIGAADIIQDIIDDFVTKMQLKPFIGDLLRAHFEQKYGTEMDSYSASRVAKEIKIPVLVVHDENDEDVPVSAANHIHQNLENSQIMLTKGLGHRKILGNEKVIKKILNFIES